MTLTEFLLARIAEDELWAREACRHHQEPLVEGGEHWGWWCPNDHEVKPDPGAAEEMECPVDESWSLSLRSREQYPYRSLPGTGPSIHFSVDSELRPEVAGHIARHDPARVLAECEAKRRIIERQQLFAGAVDAADLSVLDELAGVLRLFALPYADHPDYDETWRP